MVARDPDSQSVASQLARRGVLQGAGLTAVAALLAGCTSTAKNATYLRSQKITTPSPFLSPLLTNGTGINPTVVIGHDPVTGLFFGIDRPTTSMACSADGSTWTTGKSMPGGCNHIQLHKVVRFLGNDYVFAIDGGDHRASVYRAIAPANPTSSIVYTGRVALMSASTSASGLNYEAMNGKSTAFNAGTSAMMLGDYGDFASGPTIQRTLDGTTWTTVWGPSTSRHVHGVAEDPYHPGTWYATIGDGAANPSDLIRSTNNGDTWTTIVSGSGGNLFQSVQISFSERFVYLAADHYGASAFFMDRTECVIRNLSVTLHVNIAIPGGVGGRIITDVATTSGSTTVTSASFTAFDRGRTIAGDMFPQFGGVSNASEPNWIIAASAGTATIRAAATATGTAQTAVVGGDRFMSGCYMGAVDPATDIFYFAAMDTSSAGNCYGIFYIPQPGGRVELLDAMTGANPAQLLPVAEFYIAGGVIYTGTRRFAAITL
jgi:hypothetical protein